MIVSVSFQAVVACDCGRFDSVYPWAPTMASPSDSLFNRARQFAGAHQRGAACGGHACVTFHELVWFDSCMWWSIRFAGCCIDAMTGCDERPIWRGFASREVSA